MDKNLIAVWVSANDGIQFWNENEGFVSEKSKATSFETQSSRKEALWRDGWSIIDMDKEPRLGDVAIPLGGRFAHEIAAMQADIGQRGEVIELGAEKSAMIAVTQADLVAEKGWWYERKDYGIVVA